MIIKLRYLVFIFWFLASVRAFNNYSVYEDVDILSFFEPEDGHANGFTYPDGTGLMQLLHSNSSGSDYDNNLYIRLLHPNGTLTKFTVPTYNNTEYAANAFPLNDGYVFIAQANHDQVMYGMLVDWSGQILQR